MRVRIKGIVDAERLSRTLERVAEYLEASGVQKIQGINFYLTPLHPETGEEALIVDSLTREPIDTILIDSPTKKATTRKSRKIKAVNTEQSKSSQKKGSK